MRRQLMLLILSFISAMLISQSVNAGAFKSGYAFMQKCSSAKAQDWGICLGYVPVSYTHLTLPTTPYV